MKASQFFISTLKEAPADAEVVSHKLMTRAGLIKKLGAGIYNYMPMGLRVIRKVEAIVREDKSRAKTRQRAGVPDGQRWVARLARAAQGKATPDVVKRAGFRLAAHYLQAMKNGLPLDAVARFHLGNGARVERLNWAADLSAKGLKQSLGLMVNYLYDLKRLDKHRGLLAQGRIPVSSDIEALCK